MFRGFLQYFQTNWTVTCHRKRLTSSTLLLMNIFSSKPLQLKRYR